MAVLEILFIVVIVFQLLIFFLIFYRKARISSSEKSYLLDKIAYEMKQLKQEITTDFKHELKEEHAAVRETISEKNLVQFQTLIHNFRENTTSVSESVQRTMQNFSQALDQRLSQSQHHASQNLLSIKEELAKVYETQQQMGLIAQDVQSLKKVLQNKKARGVYGEVQLYTILETMYGENANSFFEKQKKIKDKIADAVLYFPNQIGMMAIDSKFPMETYEKIMQNEARNITLEKQFEQDMKKHIHAISKKYIVEGITADIAILFLPLESIYHYLLASGFDIITYGIQNNVWICSPTNLMAIISVLKGVFRDFRFQESNEEFRDQLRQLKQEFLRFDERWISFYQHFDMTSRDVDKLIVTSRKIKKQCDKLSL